MEEKLKRNLMTFDQIDRRVYRARNGSYTRPPDILHQDKAGKVTAYVPYLGCMGYWLDWSGSLLEYGYDETDEKATLPFASVWKLSDGDTGYIVCGTGFDGVKDDWQKARLRLWRRYIRAFTPHDPRKVIEAGSRVFYRVRRDGCVEGPWSAASGPQNRESPNRFGHGMWRTVTKAMRPKPEDWAKGDGMKFADHPKFMARSRRFVRELRRQLKGGPEHVIQLLHKQEGRTFGPESVQFSVCLPPTRTKNGPRIIVGAAMHTYESQHTFHVDEDYTLRHSQYYVWSDPQNGDLQPQKILRFKCGKKAMAAIIEWVWSHLRIPGPE